MTAKRSIRGVIIGSAIGILCLLGAALFGFNAAVSNTYNATAATLQANVRESKKASADLDKLAASQQQVNAQLHDAEQSTAVQLPNVRQAIASAQAVSQRLDRAIAQKRAGNKATSSKGAKVESSPDSSSPNDANKQNDDAQKKEQQKKLDALLKQNQSSQTNGNSSGSTTTTPDKSTRKPW